MGSQATIFAKSQIAPHSQRIVTRLKPAGRPFVHTGPGAYLEDAYVTVADQTRERQLGGAHQPRRWEDSRAVARKAS